MRRAVLVIGLALSMFMLSVGTALAGPQPLPWAACDGGTANAHAIGAQGLERIPHTHDWDDDGILACYHSNVTYPLHVPGDGLE